MMCRLLFLVVWAAIAGVGMAADAPAKTGLQAVWLGQDEHDYCQTSSALGPNAIQDLHLRLEGLRLEEEIDTIIVRRDGGGEWRVSEKTRNWRGHVLRDPKAPVADVYLEPSHNEASCRLDIELQYRSGTVQRTSLKAGRSNPNLFMPAAILKATWVGLDGHDWTGLGPAVGPDGFEDARLDLTGLSTKLEIQAITVQGSAGSGWEYGLNPQRRSNAELLRDKQDKSRGSLFFSPDRDLQGEKLEVRITYKIERSNATTVIAGATDPKRSMPKPADIPISFAPLKVQWLGQDGLDVNGPGNVHVVVDGLPSAREILAAGLSDKVGGYWIYRRDSKVSFYPKPNGDGPPSLPLAIQQAAGTTRAALFFPPFRDEANTPMILRLLLDDGTTLVHQFTGSACDPYLRGPMPSATSVEAKPGVDLHTLATQFGTIRLAPGRYVLDRPLTLGAPITIAGHSNAVLVFTQKDNEPAWTGAILIGASHVTLRGFSIRFEGPFRWDVHGRIGAALIRSFDKAGSRDPKAGIVLENLDVESSAVPPPPDPSKPSEAPYLTRLSGATSGKILGSRLRGGIVDVANGPWLIARNEHRGTVPGTVTYDAFGTHWTHDYTLEQNRVYADGPSGKTWRFFTVNQLGQTMVIRSNDVSGVGIRDNDIIPNPNAPEILLTESYRLYYEGKPASISRDGWVLQIPMLMQGVVRAGSIVSILSGEHAGRYFTVAQPLTPTAFLMDEPLPAGDYCLSVAHGFVDGLIEHNRIDVRGGSSAVVVLAGNHWNFRVLNNHLLGGGDSMLVQATPTEDPFVWGWSHTPFMGFVCEENVHEDSRRGVSVDVHSNRYNKTTAGRTYMSGKFCNNTIVWSEAMAGDAGLKTRPTAEAIRIGSHSTEEAAQMKLVLKDNYLENRGGKEPLANLEIRHAIINHQLVAEQKLALPSKK